MTIEEKARAYDDTLQRALVVKMRNPFNTVGQMVEYIFPELKENNEERIRNALITIIKYRFEDDSAIAPGFNITKEQVLAWLEKQGHMLDPDKVIEWIDEHVPTKFEDMANYVQQFKEDFGL